MQGKGRIMKTEDKIKVTQARGEELELAFQIRKEVFVEEQGVPLQDEFDEYDKENNMAYHILVIYEGQAAATGRLRQIEDMAKLERICVRSSLRKFGLGSVVISNLEKMALAKGFKRGKIHAQTQAEVFYEKLGYSRVSEEFMEDGIPHIIMVKELV